MLAKENGEWRINTPPRGLLVAEYSFTSLYQPYDLYFVGNGTSLVPDPIYLPALNNPANVASALVKALLNGPSKWLKPAVSTAVPPNTTLSVDSVTITDGIADVQLSDSVLALPDPQRSLLAAQIAYTLKQAGGVKGVAIKVNQQPFRVPGSDPNNPVVSVESIPRDIDPIPFVAGEQLYAVDSGGVVKRVSTTNDSRTMSALPRPIDHGKYPVNALAVSVTNTDLAATTNDRTTLIRAPIATGKATRVAQRQNGAAQTTVHQVWRDLGHRSRGWQATNVDVHRRQQQGGGDIDSPMLQNGDGVQDLPRRHPDGPGS